MYRKNPKLLNQFQYCEKEGIPFMVLVGEEEKANGGVKIRNVETRKEVSAVKTNVVVDNQKVKVPSVHPLSAYQCQLTDGYYNYEKYATRTQVQK